MTLAGIASKREKVGLTFLKFQSMSILAIRSDRRHETVPMPKVSIVLNNKTGLLLSVDNARTNYYGFLKVNKERGIAPLRHPRNVKPCYRKIPKIKTLFEGKFAFQT